MNGSAGLNDDPTPASTRWVKRGMGAFYFVAGALALWTILVCQFVPSPLGLRISALAAIGAGAIYALWAYVDPVYARNTPERAARLARAPMLADPLSRTILFGLFMGLTTFEAVSGAGLEIWTRVTGVPTMRVLHLGDYHGASRSGCSGFDLREAPLKLHRFVCANFPEGAEPPPGTPIYVRGPASGVGIDVRLFRIVPGERPAYRPG